MKQIKLLLVSPCFGSYGGIEAFVLAVADAVRREPDFIVRVCFKSERLRLASESGRDVAA